MPFYTSVTNPRNSLLLNDRVLSYNDRYDIAVESVEFEHSYGQRVEVVLKGELFQKPNPYTRKSMFNEISRVEVNGPCTIVYFSNGSKEIVRKTESDSDNLEIAILYAVAKHCYGSNSKMHKHLYKLIDGALDRQEAREVTQQIRAEKKAKKKAEADKKKRRS